MFCQNMLYYDYLEKNMGGNMWLQEECLTKCYLLTNHTFELIKYY